jgi:hypothetical protein
LIRWVLHRWGWNMNCSRVGKGAASAALPMLWILMDVQKRSPVWCGPRNCHHFIGNVCIEASLNDGIRCFVHFSNDLCSSFFLGADPFFTK